MRSTVLLIGLLAVSGSVAAVSACGSNEGGGSPFVPTDAGEDAGPLAGLVAIDISPASVDLVGGDTNGSQTFTAQGRFVDGSTRDLTSELIWKGTPDAILAVNGPKATATGLRGGVATVSAFVGAVTGTAEVRVKFVKTVLAPGAAPGSEARFQGTTEDATLAPLLAYPLDGALVPPNLPPMEVQWQPAGTTDLFDVAIAGPNLDVHIITPCNAIGSSGGCGLLAETTFWSSITGTLAGQDAAKVTVRAAGGTAGKSGTSAGANLQFAGEDLRGGLYYFNTRATLPDKPGIFRYDFASAKVGPFFTQGQCAGCHALSPDGTKMLAPICTDERGCGRPMQLAVVDVATRQVVTPPMPVGDSDTQTWTPDNAFYVTTPQCGAINPNPPGACTTPGTGVMKLISAATNTEVATIPSGAGAMYPAFSTDGKKLIYARAGTFKGPLSIQKSGLYILDVDTTKTPPTFGTEQTFLTSSGIDFENNYHPSFSPDDKWVLFSRSNCLAGDNAASNDINGNVCDSYNDYTARSFIVSAAGGTPIELTKANGQGRNSVSWPKWAPFKTASKGGEVFWITIGTTRDYGFRAMHTKDAQGNATGGVTQLWLVAFDPARAASGADPSFAPIWLPFQDVLSSNHIGQWATKIVGSVN
jgi:WD40-like Beta Propeller Repeat